MSIRNAGKMIREARKKSGLTLEHLSENICSIQSLSRIEKGQSSVSQGTFAALMERTGCRSSILPEFESMDDFECVNHLNYASFHLHACQLQAAFDELHIVESLQWNHNKFYYQRWLLLHAQIQILTMETDPQSLLTMLERSLAITCPDLDYWAFQKRLLSACELDLLLCIAHTFLLMEKADQTLPICSQVQTYIVNSNLSEEEKDVLLAKRAIVFSHYLLLEGDIQAAYQLAEQYRVQMIFYHQNALLLLLTFITALCRYHLGEEHDAKIMFRNAYYSAHAIQSHLATYFLQYIQNTLQDDIHIDSTIFEDITIHIPMVSIHEVPDLGDGVYDADHPGLSFGQLIQELRIQRKITQQQLCDGLCTKSKLSKIENGTLQPDTILAETLLQRLGISEREFVFYGTEKEEKYHTVKNYAINYNHFKNREQVFDPSVFDDSIFTDDPLYKQVLLLSKISFTDSKEERLAYLHDALSCTIPSFDETHFSTHLFSWAELSILNNIAFYKGFLSPPFETIRLFHKILEYRKQHPISIIFETQIYSITFSHFARFLSRNSYDKELYQLFLAGDHISVYYDLSVLAGFYCFVSQSAFLESSDPSKIKYTYYTYALMLIVEKYNNALHFHDAFQSFTSTDIDY